MGHLPSTAYPACSRTFQTGYGSSVVLTNDGQQGGWSNEKEQSFTFELAMDALVRSGVPATG